MACHKQHKTILIGFFYILSVLHAEVPPHYYEVEKGIVEYEILGGAQLTKETNLNIHGTSKLHFKDWGNTRQEEDAGIVVTHGAINDVQEVKRLEKHIDGKVLTVDYKHEQILEHTESKVKPSQEKETLGLVHRGQDVVAGLLCTMWIGSNVKKCLYKGIVLKQESHILGVSYLKKAIKVTLDSNSSSTQCVLPSFPINTFGLLKDKFKTKKSSVPEDLCKVFKDAGYNVDANNKGFDTSVKHDDKKRQKFINKIAEGIFIKQKETLPALLFAMKKSRECLQLANDIFEKQRCSKNYTIKKNNLGFQKEDYKVFGNDRNMTMDAIEDAIINLEPRMSCVKRAKNFIDISSCMK